MVADVAITLAAPSVVDAAEDETPPPVAIVALDGAPSTIEGDATTPANSSSSVVAGVAITLARPSVIDAALKSRIGASGSSGGIDVAAKYETPPPVALGAGGVVFSRMGGGVTTRVGFWLSVVGAAIMPVARKLPNVGVEDDGQLTNNIALPAPALREGSAILVPPVEMKVSVARSKATTLTPRPPVMALKPHPPEI